MNIKKRAKRRLDKRNLELIVAIRTKYFMDYLRSRDLWSIGK